MTWSTSRIRRRRYDGCRTGRRGGRTTRAWPRERARSQASSAATGSASAGRPAATDGPSASTASDARDGDDERGQQRPGPAAAVGARARAPARAASIGLGRVEDLAGDPFDDLPRRRRDQRASCPAGRRSRPVTIAESRAPRASRSPSGSARLTPATRSSSSVVSRVVSRPRVRCQVAALPRGAGEPEPPVGDDVPADREQRDDDQHAEHQQRDQDGQGDAGGTSTSARVEPLPEADRLEQLAGGTERGRGDDDAAAGQRREPHPRRVEGHDVALPAPLGRPPRRPRSRSAAARPAGRGPGPAAARRGRSGPRRSVEAVPVPIRTLVSPSSRWIGEEVRSTVRTRSTGVESTCRLSSPRRSSIRPPVIRKLVVR